MDVTIHRGSASETKRWYRISVCAFYFIQGLVFASWASRIPDIKNMLGMNEAELGGVLFIIPIGQLSAMALSGYLVSRYVSRLTLIAAALLYPAALVSIGMVSSVFELSAALFFFGMTANLCNIAVNTQGVGVEKLYGHSIMATFHGLWSLAGFTGGLISTLMVGIDIPPFFHFCMIYAVALAVVLTMKNTLLPRDEARKATGQGKTRIFTRPDRFIMIIGLIAFGSMVCEGTMFDWSSVYFEEVIRPPRELIRLGYIASMCSMATGRFLADRMIMRFGVVNILRVCGVIITAGLLMAVAVPNLWFGTIGFLLVGFGVSAIVPICYSLAGRSGSMLPGVALATVSTIGFFGFLLGPPVIGFIAHALDLRWSLGIVSVVGILTALLAPLLRRTGNGIE